MKPGALCAYPLYYTSMNVSTLSYFMLTDILYSIPNKNIVIISQKFQVNLLTADVR